MDETEPESPHEVASEIWSLIARRGLCAKSAPLPELPSPKDAGDHFMSDDETLLVESHSRNEHAREVRDPSSHLANNPVLPDEFDAAVTPPEVPQLSSSHLANNQVHPEVGTGAAGVQQPSMSQVANSDECDSAGNDELVHHAALAESADEVLQPSSSHLAKNQVHPEVGTGAAGVQQPSSSHLANSQVHPEVGATPWERFVVSELAARAAEAKSVAQYTPIFKGSGVYPSLEDDLSSYTWSADDASNLDELAQTLAGKIDAWLRALAMQLDAWAVDAKLCDSPFFNKQVCRELVMRDLLKMLPVAKPDLLALLTTEQEENAKDKYHCTSPKINCGEWTLACRVEVRNLSNVTVSMRKFVGPNGSRHEKMLASFSFQSHRCNPCWMPVVIMLAIRGIMKFAYKEDFEVPADLIIQTVAKLKLSLKAIGHQYAEKSIE